MIYTKLYKKIKNESIKAVKLSKTSRTANGEKGELKSANGLIFENGYVKTRGRRARVRAMTDACGIHGDDTVAYVDAGKLYYGGNEVAGVYLTVGEKTILKSGKYLIIYPDEVYVDLENTFDFGRMSISFQSESARGYIVNSDFEEIFCSVVSKEPEEPTVGSYYLIKDGSGKAAVKYFDGSVWSEVNPLVKISAEGIGAGLRVGDTVKIIGPNASGTVERIIYRDANSIAYEGVIDVAYSGRVTVERAVPNFDYACVCGGRLVGVRRGRDKNGALVSKVYASEEGNPFNFEVGFGGMEKDVDISGPFTAVCDYLGSPLAFTESEIIELRVKNGALISTVIKTSGVQAGAYKSVSVGGGRVYYKSREGICSYDGSYPERISDGIGKLHISESGSPSAYACGKYYVTANDEGGAKRVFVFDTAIQAFCTEDDFGIKAFAVRGSNLYALFESEGEQGIVLMDYDGALPNEKEYLCDEGFPVVEDGVDWAFETGNIGTASFEAVRPVKAVLRIKKPIDTTVSVCALYDGEQISSDTALVSEKTDGIAELPIILKKCNKFSIKVTGKGQCEIYGYAVYYREGGQMR